MARSLIRFVRSLFFSLHGFERSGPSRGRFFRFLSRLYEGGGGLGFVYHFLQTLQRMLRPDSMEIQQLEHIVGERFPQDLRIGMELHT